MSVFSEILPSKPKWTAQDMPDCTGKVYIVTGGNSGIGFETCKLRRLSLTGHRASFLELDLASLASVKRAANEFISKESQLHVLFNNGGVMVPPPEQLTSDGYDLQFGTNVLGHFYFTKLLLPILLATTGPKPRIVNTSSIAYRGYPKIEYDILRDSPKRLKFGKWNYYGQSKFATILLSNELARRYGDKLVSVSLHPGGIRTNLQRHADAASVVMAKFSEMFLAEPWMGAITQLYAGTSPEGANLNGKYLIPYARVGKPNAKSNDVEAAKKLSSWLEEQGKDL
ncbi:NAD(P)-binding protein [Exidia glandulosa HHB12029]|uniref:NAD(P)-binding protein n=1 Tax=Exidia glandulosa HHB12029 TaxID=1314781 RepID=A0A165GP98_EXIGL|nr:NAD(P)-binding protein [Exidia glandulosa HHB12029]